MGEKRRYERWGLEKNAYVDLGEFREEVRVLDVSIGGMRVVTNVPLDKNKDIKSEFRILPNVGPFFVQGKVIWTIAREEAFESGIVFDKVSTTPLS